MIHHLPVMPIVLPALFAAAMLMTRSQTLQRALAWASVLVLVAIGANLMAMTAEGWRGVYLLGNWAAPWGIVVIADRLSALMVTVTAVLTLVVLASAQSGWDGRGKNFHPLLQIQLMGLNGAFLTGDIFNLFVFFEVLLIASYGLLVHGDGRDRMVAGLRFVTLNLLGSTLFLFAAGILFGVGGSLNMADLSSQLPQLEGSDATLARSGIALLMVVFLLKSAILPLYFWLPPTYGAVTPPVAALFAVMTKVGLYSLLRVQSLLGGEAPSPEADVPMPWLALLAAASFGLAMIATLAAADLRRMTAMLIIASAGLLLSGIALGTEHSIAASLYYLVHTTFSAAALFLVCDLVARARGVHGDRLRVGVSPARPALVGGLFFVAAAAMVGLPPFGGFIGKAMLLQATLPLIGEIPNLALVGFWAAFLVGTLFGVIALSRAGSRLFWKSNQVASGNAYPIDRSHWGPVLAALALVAGVTLSSAPLQHYSLAAARDLLEPGDLIDQTLTERPLPGPHNPNPETRR